MGCFIQKIIFIHPKHTIDREEMLTIITSLFIKMISLYINRNVKH